MNGRPLTLEKLDAAAPAVLEAWFGGIEAGNAVADVLFGDVNPGGKLPVTFPRAVGQVPIYYNHEPTGRPCDATQKYNSRYLDQPCEPLYPFGYGLSYTSFAVTNLELSSTHMRGRDGAVRATVDVANTGGRDGRRGRAAVHQRPRREHLPARAPAARLRAGDAEARARSTTVGFRLDASDVGFYDNRGRFVVEPGRIDVYAGDSSTATLKASFEVTR